MTKLETTLIKMLIRDQWQAYPEEPERAVEASMKMLFSLGIWEEARDILQEFILSTYGFVRHMTIIRGEVFNLGEKSDNSED